MMYIKAVRPLRLISLGTFILYAAQLVPAPASAQPVITICAKNDGSLYLRSKSRCRPGETKIPFSELRGETGPAGNVMPSGIFAATVSDGSAVNLTRYLPPDGGTISVIEQESQIMIPVGCTIRNFAVRITVSPGPGKTRTFTLRVNGQDTPISCEISDSGAVCSSGSTVAVEAGDLIAIKAVLNSSAQAFGFAKIAFECRDEL